jgi:1,4-dihydroxy-2-naphthoate octaprenyltransferase
MLWLKIVHLVTVIFAAFTIGLLFSKWSGGKWRRIDMVTLIATAVTIIAIATVIIRDDF